MAKKAKKLKLKTHRGAAKRFKRTKSGKFLRGKAFKQHILGDKTRKRKRALRATPVVTGPAAAKLARMLPFTWPRSEHPTRAGCRRPTRASSAHRHRVRLATQ